MCGRPKVIEYITKGDLFNLPLVYEEWSWDRGEVDLRLVLLGGILIYFETVFHGNLI